MKALPVFLFLCLVCACNHKPSVEPSDTNIFIFPNPVSDVLNVQVLNNKENLEFWLMDNKGELVFQKTTDDQSFAFSVLVRNLPKGNYYLEGKKSGKPFRKLFTKL